MSSAGGWFTAWKPEVRRRGVVRLDFASACHAETSATASSSEESFGDPKSNAMLVAKVRECGGPDCRNAPVQPGTRYRIVGVESVAFQSSRASMFGRDSKYFRMGERDPEWVLLIRKCKRGVRWHGWTEWAVSKGN